MATLVSGKRSGFFSRFACWRP